MKKIVIIAVTGLVLIACNNNGTGTDEMDTTTTYDNTQNADTSMMRDTSMTDTMHFQNDTMPQQ